MTQSVRSFVLFCAFLCSFLFISPLYAANRANAVTLTLGGGIDFFASKRNIDVAGMPLLILGYDFTSHWGAEALVSFFNTRFKASQHDNRTIDGNLILVDGLYHFSPFYQSIDPFIMAGTGVTRLNPNFPSANNEANINAGLGVQFFANPSVALRLDVRDVYTIIGGKNDIVLVGGVTFLMGGCPS